MAFGIYIHIPYCLQRCTYCDFATYVHSEIMPSNSYISLLHKEIETLAPLWAPQKLKSIYFGGGTPSLLPAEEIISVINAIEKHGFAISPETEVTIEINPATVSEEKLKAYIQAGANRFSVGAQTFNDALLKSVKREHNSAQTRETLDLLKKYKLNYSFDLLFALPNQSLEILKNDLQHVVDYLPPHISPYCLTVPEGHPLSKLRLHEDLQVEMFGLIAETLTRAGYEQYEISNFAQPGFESKHNSLYWDDDEYWGIGLSSHSYSKHGGFGSRFWNPPAISEYEKLLQKLNSKPLQRFSHLPKTHFENLERHQSLTDFCHTSLRKKEGLSIAKLQSKYGTAIADQVRAQAETLVQQGLLEPIETTKTANSVGNADEAMAWRLSKQGILISNVVFEKMAFLSEDLSPLT